MIWEERPGVHRDGPRLGQRGQADDEVLPVGVVPEDDAPLEPPHHTKSGIEDSGRRAEGIQAGLAGHGVSDLCTRSARRQRPLITSGVGLGGYGVSGGTSAASCADRRGSSSVTICQTRGRFTRSY